MRPGGADTLLPLASGQRLAGTGIERMTPAEAHDLLNSEAICHNFRWVYMFDGQHGFGEVWCEPPPGAVQTFTYQGDGTLVVFVRGEPPPTPRSQPQLGWGC